MTKHTLVLLALLVWACGGSSDGDSGSGGAAGSGGSAGGGGAAGATGGSAGGGAAGAAGSGATTQCDALSDQHAAAVEKTKACTVGSTTACTTGVDTSVAGCGTYVYGDSSNTAALAELDSLKQQFKTLACPYGSCALGGFPPVTAECQPTGQGGASGVCTPK